MKYLFVFVFFILYFSGHAQVEVTNTQDSIFTVCDSLPKYPNGIKALYSHIKSNLYCKANDIPEEGIRMIAYFVVEEDGSVSNVRIVQGSHVVLDHKVLNAIENSDKWQAAMHNGKNVRFQIVLPIRFVQPKVKFSNRGISNHTPVYNSFDSCNCREMNMPYCTCSPLGRNN